MVLIVLSYLLALLAIVFATRWGGQPERRAAAVVLLMLVISAFGLIAVRARFNTVDPIAIAQDTLGLIGFAAIGITSRRIWPLWAAAFQLLSVGAHFVRVLDLPVRPIVYAWMKSGPTWAVLVLLIIGTLANARSTRSRGSARSWRG